MRAGLPVIGVTRARDTSQSEYVPASARTGLTALFPIADPAELRARLRSLRMASLSCAVIAAALWSGL